MNRRGFIKALMLAPVLARVSWADIADHVEPIAPGIARDIRLSYDEILSATLRKYRAEICANVARENTLLKLLRERHIT